MTSRTEKLLRRVFPPMLATLTDKPPATDGEWVYEIKYDGFRALAAIVDGELALWSRNELDLASRFPKIASQLAKLKISEAVLDGEIVATDEAGIPRFQLLQGGASREVIYLFDILWLNGEDLRKKTCEQRRAILASLLPRPPAHVALGERLELSGEEAIEYARRLNYEGIIAKKKTSTYEPRRSKEWLKLKVLKGQELAIIGWNPSSHSSKEIGSLHLAYVDDSGAFRYAGKVGTGFSAKQRLSLREELANDVVDSPVAKDAPRIRVATWVRPRLVAQVSFTEWTDDNRLRHPAFLGLRDDKTPAEVFREREASLKKKPAVTPTSLPGSPNETEGSKKTAARARRPKKGEPSSADLNKSAAAPRGRTPARRRAVARREAPGEPVVTFTHPERILYPKDQITKKDVAGYYASVSAAMIATLTDRPLALEHWNSGIDKPSWFHQDAGRDAPAWVTTIDTPTRSVSRKVIRHLVADRPETLQWLAQMSVLTLHMWPARGVSLEEPDWVVFDLDPAKGKGIEQAIEAALVLRRLLENLDLPSIPKTSGKRGIHLFVPLAPGHSHEQALAFASSIATAVAGQVPDITVERAIAQRRGRLYLDALQNGYGKTIVAPYSLRALDGAPVSAPLLWNEINRKLDPMKFTLKTMPKRLDKVGDLFTDALRGGVQLPTLQ